MATSESSIRADIEQRFMAFKESDKAREALTAVSPALVKIRRLSYVA